jgi:hypothetical protein
MTKDEALRLALKFIEANHSGGPDAFELIDIIKSALEAKDEPELPVSIGVDVTKEGTHVVAMRLRPNGVNEVIYSQFHPLAQLEAKYEPVEFFDWYDNAHWGNEDFKEGCHRAWNAAIKYTAKTNQEAKDEPVGWFGYDSTLGGWFETNEGDDDSIPLYKAPPKQEAKDDPVAWLKVSETLGGFGKFVEAKPNEKGAKPVYTTPPQRTWVGLTDEEVADIERNSITRRQAIRAIEAKLKEKNT